MLIQHEPLRAIVRAICAAAGSTGDEPALVADNLVDTNLTGHDSHGGSMPTPWLSCPVDTNLTGHDSHGVGMLPRYIACALNGQLKVNQHVAVAQDNGALLTLDGQMGYGQVIGGEAMALGIERAQEHGVAVLTLRNSFHLGRIGAWAEQSAKAGMISMHYVNVIGQRALVAPFRGGDARYATNPFTCVMPGTAENPATLLDMATSVIAMGKVRVAKNKGEPVAEGALIDADGRPTTDPNVMYSQPIGAVLPFGEHKGYGMALMAEMLAGVLSGGQTMRAETLRQDDTIINNMLAIIFDPRRLVD